MPALADPLPPFAGPGPDSRATGLSDQRSRLPNADQFDSYLEWGDRIDAPTGGYGVFYGASTVVGGFAEGGGAAHAFTDGDAPGIGLDAAYVGWRSGRLFSVLGQDAVDISFGAQEFTVGDRFLIHRGQVLADGTLVADRRAVTGSSAVLRLNTHPLGADFYYLGADNNQGAGEQVGANLEYNVGPAHLGAAYVRSLGALDAPAAAQNVDVWDARIVVKDIPRVPGLAFGSEAVLQSGMADGVAVDALGWTLTGKYTFARMPWAPYLRYRYSRQSGDDPDTAAQEGFDARRYGWTGYGGWYQGDIVGGHIAGGGNQRAHMIQVGVMPAPWLQVDAYYFRYDLDETAEDFPADADDRFADEFNVILRASPLENLSFGLSYSYAQGGDAAGDAFGDATDIHAAEAFFFAAF